MLEKRDIAVAIAAGAALVWLCSRAAAALARAIAWALVMVQ
jgi:hypothetical protein